MKLTTNTILTAGSIAFAGFAAWFALKKTGVIAPESGEQQRMAGTNAWLATGKQQTQAVDGAISQQWQSLAPVFKAQPDFWI